MLKLSSKSKKKKKTSAIYAYFIIFWIQPNSEYNIKDNKDCLISVETQNLFVTGLFDISSQTDCGNRHIWESDSYPWS